MSDLFFLFFPQKNKCEEEKIITTYSHNKLLNGIFLFLIMALWIIRYVKTEFFLSLTLESSIPIVKTKADPCCVRQPDYPLA